MQRSSLRQSRQARLGQAFVTTLMSPPPQGNGGRKLDCLRPPWNPLRCYRSPVEFASMALTVARTLAGTGVSVPLRIPRAYDQRELLHAAAADRFAGVEV